MAYDTIEELDGLVDHDWLFSHKRLMLVTRDGLGDHIVAAGLATWMSQHVDTVYIPGRRGYWPTVDWIYSKVDNIIPIGLEPGSDWNTLVKMSEQLGCQMCRGFLGYQKQSQEPWPHACYSQYHLPYKARFDHWPNPAPGAYSDYLYRKVVKQPNYIVVHASSSERSSYNINITCGRDPAEMENLQVVHIEPGLSNNLGDWFTVLANAQEIHLVDSSPYRLCEQIAPHLKGKVFFHNIRVVDFVPSFERDCRDFLPNWNWIDYPYKKWR